MSAKRQMTTASFLLHAFQHKSYEKEV